MREKNKFKNKIIIIFFGPPGSGKGTQVDLLREKFGLARISTGDLLRREIATKSDLSDKVQGYMARGELVPNGLIKQLLAKYFDHQAGGLGFIFDGYPRNPAQNADLVETLAAFTKPEDKVFAMEIKVSDREVLARLSGRRACACGAVYHLKYNPPKVKDKCDLCGRELFIRNDDQPAVIKQRLKIFHEQTQPILDYWQKQGKLIRINGEQDIKKVAEETRRTLKIK